MEATVRKVIYFHLDFYESRMHFLLHILCCVHISRELLGEEKSVQ